MDFLFSLLGQWPLFWTIPRCSDKSSGWIPPSPCLSSNALFPAISPLILHFWLMMFIFFCPSNVFMSELVRKRWDGKRREKWVKGNGNWRKEVIATIVLITNRGWKTFPMWYIHRDTIYINSSQDCYLNICHWLPHILYKMSVLCSQFDTSKTLCLINLLCRVLNLLLNQ